MNDSFSTLFRPEAAVSVSGWETVRDELEETKNVSGNMTVCFKTDTESSMRPGNRLV